MRKLHYRRRPLIGRAAAIAAAAAMIAGPLAVAGAATGTAYAAKARLVSAQSATRHDHAPTCHLGNGIKHVVQIGFDNVHYFRDNPNVPIRP